jgi:hypothetical protein
LRQKSRHDFSAAQESSDRIPNEMPHADGALSRSVARRIGRSPARKADRVYWGQGGIRPMWIYPSSSASKGGGSFRRTPALVLCCALSLSPLGFSQPSPPGRKKVLTPAQQALQQQARDAAAKRDSLRAQAKQAFDSEMAREKAGDCPDASSTYEFNICYGKAVGITDQNLAAYEEAIRALLVLRSDPTGQPPMPGPAGPELTLREHVVEFDQVEQLWHSYLDTATKAAFHQFSGGTGGASFSMESRLRLVRSHMAELNDIYDMLLRL